jgi:patatin-like phospholipase/acyl hydrolase
VQKYDILSVYSHLDQNPNPVQRPLPSKQNQEYIRILSIEGGGIYGILPAHVLQYLEEKSGRPINQLFDLMVGTSTGSIPIVMLTIPGEGGKPRYTTKDVLNVYNHDADKIFYSPWYNRILTLNGVLGPKYQTSSRYQLLNSYLGNLYFDQLLNNVVLPVYEIYQKTPKLFCNWKNSGIEDQNFMMTNVLLGAISPIAFFPGVVFGSNNERFFLADAGICVNNPALASILLAMKIYPNKKYVLVSLGTGSIEGMKSPSDKMVDWGVLEWSRDIIPIMMDGNVKFNQMLLKKLFPVGIDLHSFNIQVKGVQGALDDISPSNIRKLNKYGKLLIKENKKELDELIPRLQRP